MSVARYAGNVLLTTASAARAIIKIPFNALNGVKRALVVRVAPTLELESRARFFKK